MDTLRSAVVNAKNALSTLDHQIQLEKSEAVKAINDAYSEQRKLFHAAVYEAERALRDHINATASHEWEGKKVVRTVRRGDTWNRTTVTEYGVIEVRRNGSEMPANKSWGLPDLGAPYVRILKKDGTLGKKIDSSYNGGIPHGWALCNEEKIEAA